jgi:hypothetical protein
VSIVSDESTTARYRALRAELAARESYAYAAARGLVGKVWKVQTDRPAKAIRTIQSTLTRWASSCDWIAAAGSEPPTPVDPTQTRWRLTTKGEAYLAAARAAGAGR